MKQPAHEHDVSMRKKRKDITDSSCFQPPKAGEEVPWGNLIRQETQYGSSHPVQMGDTSHARGKHQFS
jgi:hypothetical protein